jgi:L-histidine Nalpha-methyltransferase
MPTLTRVSAFANDTFAGLTSPRKYLKSKHLYDNRGSKLFRKIMQMPEYYVTRSEMEIFTDQALQIRQSIAKRWDNFDVVELGPGDGSKTLLLLEALHAGKLNFRYLPVDISDHALELLVQNLSKKINGAEIRPMHGDYFRVMQKINVAENAPMVILFLGGNIGNFSQEEIDDFLSRMSGITRKGDKVLIGFDLKKDPDVLKLAYDDPHGITRDFNLNHLKRINTELGANFNIELFDHHVSYNPQTGEMKSFLVCREPSKVFIQALGTEIEFHGWESIYMELSRKFDLSEIGQLAKSFGFKVEETFTDSQGYFVDSLWEKI